MIKNYKNAEIIYDTEGVTGRKLNEENGCEYVRLCIAVKKEVAPHVLPMPVTFFVLKGFAELTVDDDKMRLEKGDLIEVKAGSSRGWLNTGNEKLQLLAIKHMSIMQ